MYAVTARIFLHMMAIFLVGIVIKITDDYLDDYFAPPLSREGSLVRKLGRGVAAYGLLLFAVAVSLDATSACTLYLAAYAVGMFKDPDRILPTHFPAWLETVLTIAAGILLWGWQPMVSSLTIMTAVQLVDDYLDQDLDWEEQRNNLVHRWGKVEVIILAVMATALSLQLDWEKTLLVLLLTQAVNLVVEGLGRRRSFR